MLVLSSLRIEVLVLSRLRIEVNDLFDSSAARLCFENPSGLGK